MGIEFDIYDGGQIKFFIHEILQKIIFYLSTFYTQMISHEPIPYIIHISIHALHRWINDYFYNLFSFLLWIQIKKMKKDIIFIFDLISLLFISFLVFLHSNAVLKSTPSTNLMHIEQLRLSDRFKLKIFSYFNWNMHSSSFCHKVWTLYSL